MMDFAALQGIYCGPAPDPASLWLRWNLDPVLLAALVLLALVVRKDKWALVGVGALAVAFVSPLCALSAALFSARVVHHVLLVAVAAPLLASAVRVRQPSSVSLLFALSTAVLWLWHLPAAYDWAMGHMEVYWLMQFSLLTSAIAFWVAVLHRNQSAGTAILATMAAFVQMALLGALLTFTPEGLYAIHATAPMLFGMTSLADQQLGGLIMWVPAGAPFLVIVSILARRGWRGLEASA